MKTFFEWLKKLIKISAAVSTNPEVKAKLKIADKVIEKAEEKNAGDK